VWMPRGLLRICESSICVEEETDVYGRLRPGIQPILEALRNLYEGKKIIVGRDKLDVVKGVIQKVALPPLPAFFVFTPLTNPPLSTVKSVRETLTRLS
jgi:hypothetical protein